MMERSLGCAWLGIAGLIPLVGVPFAVAALGCSARVRAAQRRFWNPARSYQRWGFAMGTAGMAISFATAVLIACRVANPDLFGGC